MKDLCKIYKVGDKTMRRWLKPIAHQIGQRQGHLYNVTQVTIIFRHLGVPSVFD